MAILSDTERAILWSRFMSVKSSSRELLALTKADLRSAVDAVDQWVNDNQASFNAALPAAAQTGLTASQKAALLMFVVNKRYEVM